MGYATHPSQDVQHYQILLIITVSGKRCIKRICILKQGLQPMSKLFHPKIPGGFIILMYLLHTLQNNLVVYQKLI